MKTKNYSIQLFRLIASIMVVAIHTQPFLEYNVFLAQGIANNLSRVAVPFFFCLAGYFYMGKYQDQQNYAKSYCIKILKIYFVWGAIYFPYSFIYMFLKNKNPFLKSLIIYIRNTVFGGAHFHLWYLPALIFGIILFDFLLNKAKIKFKTILIIALLLYVIGLLGTSYYGVLSGGIKFFMDLYFKFFITTRNGLFFAFPFIVLGAALAKKNLKDKFSKNILILIIIAVYFFMAMEAFTLYKFKLSKMSDMYILLPVLTCFIMVFLIKNSVSKISQKILKFLSYEDYSLGIYLVHGVFLILNGKILNLLGLSKNNTVNFILVLLLSFLSIHILKKISKIDRFNFIKNYI